MGALTPAELVLISARQTPQSDDWKFSRTTPSNPFDTARPGTIAVGVRREGLQLLAEMWVCKEAGWGPSGEHWMKVRFQ